MAEYPEHEKLSAIMAESQSIGEFLENVEGYVLAEWVSIDGYRDKMLVPARKQMTEILAQYFEIDLVKIEAEKRQMLEGLRG